MLPHLAGSQVWALYHPPPSSGRKPSLGSVPSSSIFSCLGHHPPLNCTLMLPHLAGSQVWALYHPPPSSGRKPSLGSVPSSCIFSCLGHHPPLNVSCLMLSSTLFLVFLLSGYLSVSHFHLHRLINLIFFIHTQGMSILLLVQPGLPHFQCDFFHFQ